MDSALLRSGIVIGEGMARRVERVGRAEAPPAVGDGVAGDGEEPAAEGGARSCVIAVDALDCAGEDLGGEVVGGVRIADLAVTEAVDRRRVAVVERREGTRVGLRGLDPRSLEVGWLPVTHMFAGSRERQRLAQHAHPVILSPSGWHDHRTRWCLCYR